VAYFFGHPALYRPTLQIMHARAFLSQRSARRGSGPFGIESADGRPGLWF